MDYPINPDIPAPINGYGGYGAMNYEMGLSFPTFDLPTVPLDTGASNWFSATNLNAWFITRSARPVWDLTALSTFVFSESGSVGNGQGVYNGTGVKGAGFTLSCRKGQGIALMMRFAGVSAAPETVAGNLPTTGLTGTPLGFDRFTFGALGAFDSVGVVGATLQFNTGLTPNMELDGTYAPVEQNAGTPSATLTVECNALNTIAPPGWNPSTNVQTELTDQTLIIRTVKGGMPVDITFTMKRLLIRDPRNRRGTAGRAMRSYTYDILAPNNAQPVVIS